MLQPIQYYKKLSLPAKAGAWFLLCNFLQKGIAALTTPIFTRLLTSDEYGMVSVFYAWQDILQLVIVFALPSVVFSKGLIQNETKKESYTSTIVGLSIATTIVSFFVYFLFYKQISKIVTLPLAGVFAIYIYSFFTAITDFWIERKRVDYKYIPLVCVTLFLIMCKPISAIVSIIMLPAYRVEARIVSDIVFSVLVGVPLLISIAYKGKKFYDKQIWSQSLLFVLPMIPHYISQRILSQSDRIMISNMVGNDKAGIYGLAYSIGMLLMLLNNALDITIRPWAFRKMRDKQYDKVGKLSQSLILLFGLCVICFILLVPELIRIFATLQYSEAKYIIPIIAISSYFIYLYAQFIQFEYYTGKTKYIVIATLMSAAINLVLNYFCIKAFGYLAAAYTTLFCYILYAAAHYAVMKYLCHTELNVEHVFNGKYLLLGSISVTVIGIAAMGLYDHTLLRFTIAVIAVLVTAWYAYRCLTEFGATRKK